MAHRLLADIPEYGIGPPEGHDRRLGKEDADIHQNVVPPPPRDDDQERQEPERQADDTYFQRSDPSLRYCLRFLINAWERGCYCAGQTRIQHMAYNARGKN